MNRIGDYNLIEKIGAGGMGEVWRAENVHTHVPCAIKLLPGDATSDKNFVSRFFDEGRVMQTLEHPHIVRVHHVGVDNDTGRYFLAEELIERRAEGGNLKPESVSLHDLLEVAEGHRLPESDVRKWAGQVAEALAYAHEHGVIHRDIKPANVLIDEAGNAKVTDFGLAKAIGEEYVQSQIHVSISLRQGYGSQVAQSMGVQRTQTPSVRPEKSMGDEATMDTGGSGQAGRTTADALLGTYDYMSPEQRGELAGVEVSPASDIYAFGVMIYRLLTGRRPAGMAKPVSRLVKGLSKSWDLVCEKCLEHRPEDRYADGAALLSALQRGPTGRRRLSLILFAVALVAVSFIGVWWRSGAPDAGDQQVSRSEQSSPDRRETIPSPMTTEPISPVPPPPVTPPAPANAVVDKIATSSDQLKAMDDKQRAEEDVVSVKTEPAADRQTQDSGEQSEPAPPAPVEFLPPVRRDIPVQPVSDQRNYLRAGKILTQLPQDDPMAFEKMKDRFRMADESSSRVYDARLECTWVVCDTNAIYDYVSATQVAMNAGGRLPRRDELSSLLVWKQESRDWSRLNGRFFPQHRTTAFWTSEKVGWLSPLRIQVDFSNGSINRRSSDHKCAVLVVIE